MTPDRTTQGDDGERKALAKRIATEIAPVRIRSDGHPDVATRARHSDVLTGVLAGIRGAGYVTDLTCIVRRKRRWFDPRNMGDSTVICGRATVEQYLRCGYVFDWEATDRARALNTTGGPQ